MIVGPKRCPQEWGIAICTVRHKSVNLARGKHVLVEVAFQFCSPSDGASVSRKEYGREGQGHMTAHSSSEEALGANRDS